MAVNLELSGDTIDLLGGTVVEIPSNDYEKIKNKPIHSDTTAHWNAQKDLVAKKDHFYIYTDYAEKDGKAYPALKVGDGKAYLIDTPFLISDSATSSSGNVTETEK